MHTSEPYQEVGNWLGVDMIPYSLWHDTGLHGKRESNITKDI